MEGDARIRARRSVPKSTRRETTATRWARKVADLCGNHVDNGRCAKSANGT